MKATDSLRMETNQKEEEKLRRLLVYNSGDIVWLRDERFDTRIGGMSRTFAAAFKGPYNVIHRIGSATYVTRAVVNGEPTGIQMTVHGSLLRPRLSEDPVSVTMLDAPTAMDTSEEISANTPPPLENLANPTQSPAADATIDPVSSNDSATPLCNESADSPAAAVKRRRQSGVRPFYAEVGLLPRGYRASSRYTLPKRVRK